MILKTKLQIKLRRYLVLKTESHRGPELKEPSFVCPLENFIHTII